MRNTTTTDLVTSEPGAARVALESTIIAHGFPFPVNEALAGELEQAVRATGAVPQTIAIIDGVPTVGLTPAQLRHLAQHGAAYRKVAASDLAVVCVRGASAATTVSATCALAAAAGISVFATGGIGGVHRGDTGDISQDLSALAQHNVAVISAGAKSILDLPRTLEMLETLGVLVVGYQCDEFPAFYSRSSGLRLEHKTGDVAELAEICRWRWRHSRGGVLVVQPVPAEAAVPSDEGEAAVNEALAAATHAGVAGKALTPFLLRHLATALGGRFVAANRALAVANATLGGHLAHALVKP